MTLLCATTEHLEGLFALELACFEAKDSPLSKRALRYHLMRGRIIGAFEGKTLLGYILIFPRTIPRVYSLAVHPNARGRGIAQALIKEALHVKEKLRLEVRSDNHGAIALYEKLGFTCKGVKKEFYPDGCDAKVYMYSPTHTR